MKLKTENKNLNEEIQLLKAYKIKYGESCEQLQNDFDIKVKIMETGQQMELQKLRDTIDKLNADNKGALDNN